MYKKTVSILNTVYMFTLILYLLLYKYVFSVPVYAMVVRNGNTEHFVEIFEIKNKIIKKWNFKKYYKFKYQTQSQSLDKIYAITAPNISIKTPQRYTKYY
jgi:hypothetical protein